MGRKIGLLKLLGTSGNHTPDFREGMQFGYITRSGTLPEKNSVLSTDDVVPQWKFAEQDSPCIIEVEFIAVLALRHPVTDRNTFTSNSHLMMRDQ